MKFTRLRPGDYISEDYRFRLCDAPQSDRASRKYLITDTVTLQNYTARNLDAAVTRVLRLLDEEAKAEADANDPGDDAPSDRVRSTTADILV